MQIELIQVLQMLIFLFVTFFLAYGFVHSFRSIKAFLSETNINYNIHTVVLYFRKFYVVNYNCYHKFEIWRKYRFS
jgi:hypothetical protein